MPIRLALYRVLAGYTVPRRAYTVLAGYTAPSRPACLYSRISQAIQSAAVYTVLAGYTVLAALQCLAGSIQSSQANQDHIST
ncbi:hypothetical protein DPMN_090734 [Dreissena polymorpha]|uniref:Uncharacterized protein n=1 Tax=Dreissena polymorpha TaxID=45954 RepID=A0A9D4KZ54_DREPO|nr:hypothetical protein DPMN_090734 [Dreissena polymorpha]